jgi:hypothetical protein
MMTRRAVLAVMALAAAAPAVAHQAAPDAPGRGEAKATIGGKTVAVEYGRPSLKGRDMLGQAKVGDPWRMGANAPTTLKTDGELRFGTVVVPAGSYILKATRTSEDAWALNVLKGETAVADVPLTRSALPASVETFTVKLAADAADKKAGALTLEWGTTALSAGFRVP